MEIMSVLRCIIGKRPIMQADPQRWLRIAQEREFQFHRNNAWRQSDDFMRQTIRLLDNFGFSQSQFEKKTIIDLGAGSKLRSKYFSDAYIIAIEPLADRFISEIEWCDLNDASEIYSSPAETRINQCIDRADLVFSVNVLDHCYNFEAIIGNIFAYLKRDGIAFISFDRHDTIDHMHPLRLNENTCEDILKKNGFKIYNFTKGTNNILIHNTYGHGIYCLNYWLSKN